jgi:osmotically-inducible protein OsmY
MDDLKLKKSIEDELEWEPSVDAADIGVAVEDGVVTLMGHVKTYSEKMAAENAVKRVKGVRAIAQDMEVRFGRADPASDDDIARRAADLIKWNTSLPRDRIQIKAQNGLVTLSGDVDWQYQSEHARKRIGELAGVKSVTNLIKVKSRVSPNDVKQRIEKALTRSAELEAKSIRVAVADGRVTLEGKVDSWHDRDVAENAAWAAPGVKAVDDRLRIG